MSAKRARKMTEEERLVRSLAQVHKAMERSLKKIETALELVEKKHHEPVRRHLRRFKQNQKLHLDRISERLT